VRLQKPEGNLGRYHCNTRSDQCTGDATCSVLLRPCGSCQSWHLYTTQMLCLMPSFTFTVTSLYDHFVTSSKKLFFSFLVQIKEAHETPAQPSSTVCSRIARWTAYKPSSRSVHSRQAIMVPSNPLTTNLTAQSPVHPTRTKRIKAFTGSTGSCRGHYITH